tara:strand:- start:8145 stop:9458 length:1314 start_codon:yes stop_codon:yes gene_type:complete
MTPTRRDFLKQGSAALAASLVGKVASVQAAPAPNLLFILTDQHRRDGVGAYGKPSVLTPNLDRIASEGIRLDRAYTAQPVCSPNRASILSGLYPHRHGVRENNWPLSPDVHILPHLLQANAYRTGYFGKWHLGDPARVAYDVMPSYERDGRGGGSASGWAHYYTIDDQKVYQTDVISRDIGDFIRTSDKPFYAVASFYPPHPPYSVPKRYEEMYRELYPEDQNRRRYYAMCTAVDDAVGHLLETLEAKEIADNTLVVFTTEHGHYFDRRWNNHSKRSCYDVAARIPLLMRFPGHIPDGQESTALFSHADLFPTLAGLLGLAPPEVDGIDQSDLLQGKTEATRDYLSIVNVPRPDRTSKPHDGPMPGEERCVRTNDWKLILSRDRAPELYHPDNDPEERDNVWSSHRDTEVVGSLKAHLSEWASATNDPLTPRLLSSL